MTVQTLPIQFYEAKGRLNLGMHNSQRLDEEDFKLNSTETTK